MKITVGKRALITGASRGLGTVISTALAKKGIDLMLTARSENALKAEQKRLQTYGVNVDILACDLRDPEALTMLSAQACTLGIDILINNAGMECAGFFDQVASSAISDTLYVNITVPMQLSRNLISAMELRGGGHVVNLGSILAFTPSAYNEAYCASKSAIAQFSQCLRLSMKAEGRPISVSVINPGFIDDVGMYNRVKESTHDHVPDMIGSLNSRLVADAVVRAIEQDLPVVVVAPGVPRLLHILRLLLPRLYETLTLRLGLYRFARKIAEQRSHVSH